MVLAIVVHLVVALGVLEVAVVIVVVAASSLTCVWCPTTSKDSDLAATTPTTTNGIGDGGYIATYRPLP